MVNRGNRNRPCSSVALTHHSFMTFIPLPLSEWALLNTTVVLKSPFTHKAGLHIIVQAQTDQKKKKKKKKKSPFQAILALHTPRPTTHTECLWEHLWCERWRMKSPGWVWFSSPRAPFPSHRHSQAWLSHSFSPSLRSSVIFSRTMNIPPTFLWPSEDSAEVALLVLDGEKI